MLFVKVSRRWDGRWGEFMGGGGGMLVVRWGRRWVRNEWMGGRERERERVEQPLK